MKRILYIGNHLSKKSNYNSALDTLSQLLVKVGFEVDISSSKSSKLLRLMDMCQTLFKRKSKTDIVLIDTFSTWNFYYAYIIARMCKWYKLPYIPILHGGNLPSRIENSPKMSNSIFSNAYKIVAPSGYLKKAFEDKGYEVELIPNIINIEEYKFKKRLGFRPRLLWVRAFDQTYNPALAIRVLKQLKSDFPDAKLCMIGPNKDGSLAEVKKLISDFNLIDSVEITGVLPKEEWHKKSEEFDIFINTTNFDNMPVSVIEAMALGLPVVSTNVGGIPHLITDGVDGILVNPDDEIEMVNAIKQIIENTENSVEITKNARNKVEQFDWEVIKENWLKILS